LIPQSILAGRWIAVLVCYLDDSGKDPQNRVSTVAGFVGRSEAWEVFERSVEPVFEAYQVDVLHTRCLHATDGSFRGWMRVKKQAFVRDLANVMAANSLRGMSMSIAKATYRQRMAESSNRRGIITQHAYCFTAIFNWILTDVYVGKEANAEGVAFVLETGHEHNSDAERCFNAVRTKFSLQDKLRSISFAGKESSRAIQIADLLAFYTRKHAVGMERAKAKVSESAETDYWSDPMMNLIASRVPVRAFLATDFFEMEKSS
jgi:Protein of unknown function (DUF3800)